MSSTLPSVSDCCTLCEGLTVTLDYTGSVYRQVYSGAGDPNTLGIVPDNSLIANWYYDTSVPGASYQWDTATNSWV